ALHVPDRRQGPHCPQLAQGQGARPRRGGAGRGEGAGKVRHHGAAAASGCGNVLECRVPARTILLLPCHTTTCLCPLRAAATHRRRSERNGSSRQACGRSGSTWITSVSV